MAAISPEFIERYQIEYEKNPKSRIFAPLAEAYRQMGLLDEANRICSKGVQLHPEFAGGRVAFAKILVEKNEKEKALTQLEKAVELSPDNLLAHSLLGEILLELRRPKDALRAFKMVLFLNPNDEKALKAVRKWEFLSADEYDDELFKMRPVFQAEPAEPIEPELAESRAPNDAVQALTAEWRTKELDRAISLADAFTIRGEPEKALRVLKDARDKLGPTPELDKRIGLLAKRTQAYEEPAEMEVDGAIEPASQALPDPEVARKMQVLQTLLRRISERRA